MVQIKTFRRFAVCFTMLLTCYTFADSKPECVIVDTGQIKCYSDRNEISYPGKGTSYYGQDAQYITNSPAYKDNNDGTISDLNTGLMWSKAVDRKKLSLEEAKRKASKMTLGGHSDWRVPNIKELYSLIDFRGRTGFNGRNMSSIPANAIPFINTDYFDFLYGDTSNGERFMDAQWLTSTKYVSYTMKGDETLFGVNFADGRIKGYGYKRKGNSRIRKKFYVRYVRGNPNYGENKFVDNGNGTVTDKATGLMWMKIDSGKGMNWKSALKFGENLSYAGYSDWRLPDAKELQYIVDYSRSPDTTNSAAISPVFKCTAIKNEAGKKDFPFYWTSTTHDDGPSDGQNAAYISFGRAIGSMRGMVMDVHGAGAQRSDPKSGKARLGHGPQGDAVRVYNYVRCVRGGNIKMRVRKPYESKNKYPYKLKNYSVNGKSNNNDKNRFNREGNEKSRRNSRAPNFVKRLDKNGDGKVSKSEFDGPKNHFRHLDRNHDGYLSEDEAPPPPRR